MFDLFIFGGLYLGFILNFFGFYKAENRSVITKIVKPSSTATRNFY